MNLIASAANSNNNIGCNILGQATAASSSTAKIKCMNYVKKKGDFKGPPLQSVKQQQQHKNHVFLRFSQDGEGVRRERKAAASAVTTTNIRQ